MPKLEIFDLEFVSILETSKGIKETFGIFLNEKEVGKLMELSEGLQKFVLILGGIQSLTFSSQEEMEDSLLTLLNQQSEKKEVSTCSKKTNYLS